MAECSSSMTNRHPESRSHDLQKAGCEVLEAENGEKAIEVITGETGCCLTSDSRHSHAENQWG